MNNVVETSDRQLYIKTIKTIPFILCLYLCTNNMVFAQRTFNGIYANANNSKVAFPIGGIGAGMFCLEGAGAIGSMSIRHRPELYNEPAIFAALYVKGHGAKVAEGPIPAWEKFGLPGAAMGMEGTTYGLARFATAKFRARFPFATVTINDPGMPVSIALNGWSPFVPTDADDSSLPVGALEYQLTNKSKLVQSGVFSYNAANFIATGDSQSRIQDMPGGFVLSQDGTKENPEKQGDFAIFTNDPKVTTDLCWFRGGWWDPLTMAWKKIRSGNIQAVAAKENAPGASLFVPFTLRPGESRTIRVYMAWYVPFSHLRYGVRSHRSTDTITTARSDNEQPSPYYMPWYASKFKNIEELVAYWHDNYERLKRNTLLFTNAFYKSNLPPQVLEAVTANLSILKSPTVLRQYDGRFWGWEGSNDEVGSCAGNCTHVYNYAQALCHLFPSLERTIRETELNEGMDAYGHQNYREAMPIRPEGHNVFLPAADGQLGCVMRAYRDWRICGDDQWLKRLYPRLKLCMSYCINTWDPDHTGTLIEPHHNTYDIEFWGADGYSTGYYLGALEAMILITEHLHVNGDIDLYRDLFVKGKKAMESQLYNGEYFIQKINWTGLHNNPLTFRNTAEEEEPISPEAGELLKTEGPKYQYGNGCLSDGVIGSWMAKVSGLPEPLDETKVRSHLQAVYKYNFKSDLSDFSNPQRSTYALGHEGGLLLCTWPKGDALSLPFVYSNEVWTGIEYEVASHLIMEGKVNEGLKIVRTTRKRYDGTVRNPFDEYECGHWYMRAMSSYALLQALTGLRYDAVNKTLYIDSKIGVFTSFLSTDSGFGNVSYKNGKAIIKVAYGNIDIKHIQDNTKKKI